MRSLTFSTLLLAASAFAVASPSAHAQVYLQGTDTMVSSCTGNYYDSGGPAAAHSDSEDSTITFCNPGMGGIALSFSSFDLESCCDNLTIHDGPTSASPMIGAYTGSVLPGPISSTGTCLTAVFHSDGSVTRDGWAATISCGATSGENGAPCATASSCDSGYCVDGVCCSTPCDDGRVCNGTETCAGGTCASGAPIDCDDFDSCTVEMCVEGLGCQYDPIPGCDLDAGTGPRDAGTSVTDGGTSTRDAGPDLRGRRAGRRGGCCAVAGAKHTSDRTGWALTLGVLLLAAFRRRRSMGS